MTPRRGPVRRWLVAAFAAGALSACEATTNPDYVEKQLDEL